MRSAMVEFQHILNILEKHKDELPGADKSQKGQYFKELGEEFQKLTTRSEEDRRLATQIAVDTSKALVQIAIAVLVAIFGFYQFSFKHSWETGPLIVLGIAAFLIFFSMCGGFVAISNAYKRAEGRKDAGKIAWSTKVMNKGLNVQAYAGVIALLAFAGAIIFQTIGSQPARTLKITLPKEAVKIVSSSKAVKVTGKWSGITIKHEGRFTVQLEPIPDQETQYLKIEFNQLGQKSDQEE